MTQGIIPRSPGPSPVAAPVGNPATGASVVLSPFTTAGLFQFKPQSAPPAVLPAQQAQALVHQLYDLLNHSKCPSDNDKPWQDPRTGDTHPVCACLKNSLDTFQSKIDRGEPITPRTLNHLLQEAANTALQDPAAQHTVDTMWGTIRHQTLASQWDSLSFPERHVLGIAPPAPNPSPASDTPVAVVNHAAPTTPATGATNASQDTHATGTTTAPQGHRIIP